MPRRTILSPIDIGQRHELQYQFLEVTKSVCPELVEDLKRVRNGERTFDQFVAHYNLRNTWLEEAARSTLQAWEQNPIFESESRWRLPATVQEHPHDYPRFKRIRQKIETFSPHNYLYAPETVEKDLKAALEADLKAIADWADAQGYTIARRVPGSLERNMEFAAKYLFRGLTAQMLAEEHNTDFTNMWRCIRDVFRLLDLPLRGRGHRAVQNCKKQRL